MLDSVGPAKCSFSSKQWGSLLERRAASEFEDIAVFEADDGVRWLLFGRFAEHKPAVKVANGQAAFLAGTAFVFCLGLVALLTHHRLFFH